MGSYSSPGGISEEEVQTIVNNSTVWDDLSLVHNQWYIAPCRSQVSNINNPSVLLFQSVIMPECQIDGMAMAVTTGLAGQLVRVGLYGNNPDSESPLTLLVDAGTINVSVTGDKTISFTPVTHPGGRLWLAMVQQGTAGSLGVLVYNEALPSDPWIYASTISWSNQRFWQIASGVSGALPASTAGLLTPAALPQVPLGIHVV